MKAGTVYVLSLLGPASTTQCLSAQLHKVEMRTVSTVLSLSPASITKCLLAQTHVSQAGKVSGALIAGPCKDLGQLLQLLTALGLELLS
jgi:hypothetical protein